MQDTSTNQTISDDISVFCDCCENQADGTKSELISSGWGFSRGAEFCPACNS